MNDDDQGLPLRLGGLPTWVPCLLIGLALAIWIARPQGWHPWGFATQSNVFPFTDLTGRLSNIQQLIDTGNIYRYFDYLSFSYPPTAIIFFFPLHWVSLPQAYLLWSSVSMMLLAVLCHTMCRIAFPRHPTKIVIWSCAFVIGGTLLFPPVYECLDLGQTGIIIASLAIVDYTRNRRFQGVLLGISIALKIYSWPFAAALALQKRCRSVLAIFCTILLFCMALVLIVASTNSRTSLCCRATPAIASVSLGKHEPPYPGPHCRNPGAMRGSSPMA